ncbi:hypothetical protein XENTR_v10012577 [Xenopus tropicalis]|nr:hypothetical protein XENTR_v10012577 [Xenopus tropicalis]
MSLFLTMGSKKKTPTSPGKRLDVVAQSTNTLTLFAGRGGQMIMMGGSCGTARQFLEEAGPIINSSEHPVKCVCVCDLLFLCSHEDSLYLDCKLLGKGMCHPPIYYLVTIQCPPNSQYIICRRAAFISLLSIHM